jgi:hypothetical protein
MMPSGSDCVLVAGRVFLHVQPETGFWHLEQMRPVSVEYTSLELDIVTF